MNSSELRGAVAAEALDSYRATVKRAATNSEGWTGALDNHAFSLEGPSKILQPFSSAFRNAMKRTPMNPISDVARWKVIKDARALGKTTVSTSTGARGPNVEKSSFDHVAMMKRIALGDFVVDDALLFASAYEDIQATADMLVMQLLMEEENGLDIGGNITALDAVAQPIAAITAAVGSLSAGHTHDFKICGLTTAGLAESRVSGYTGAATNGSGVASAASGVTAATALNDKITVTWTDKPDAVAYDVYDQIDGAGGYLYMGTVEVNKFILSVDTVGGSEAPAVDTSADANAYDGALQLLNDALGTPTSLGGAVLTASGGSKSIAELDAMIDTIFFRDKCGPSEFWCGPRVRRAIIEKIGGSSAPSVQVQLNSGEVEMKAGLTVNTLYNPHTNESIEIKVDPNFPQGLGMFVRRSAPYAHSKLTGDSIDALVAKEYWRETFGKTSYRVDFGVSCNKVLRVRSSLGMGIIKNIGV